MATSIINTLARLNLISSLTGLNSISYLVFYQYTAPNEADPA